MKISTLFKRSGIKFPSEKISGANDFEVKGITCNSDCVREGFIFVAIKGNLLDGSRFLPQAVAKGASAVLLEGKIPVFTQDNKTIAVKVKDARLALARLSAEFYGNPCRKIKVVGVTGTNGKTTVTYLIEEILRQAGYAAGVIGTVNYRFCHKFIPAKNTTPEPVQLQSLLSQMRNAGCKFCIMEVSSHALDQERIEGIDFHSAIFTNLTQDHLDYHRTMENYFQAKCKIFRRLKKGAFAIINNDDSYAQRIKKMTSAEVVTYGLGENADIQACNLRLSRDGIEFQLKTKQDSAVLRSRLIGIHNVYNILAAVAWARETGIKIAAIQQAIRDFPGVPGRLERINAKTQFSIFVDYAHTEDALRNVLCNLRQICEGKIITVFGCGGDRDKSKRPKMGRVVSEMADYAIITNDNPRSESPSSIIADIRKGISGRNFRVITDRRKAILKSLSLAKPQDIVLIAGKGHENYQIIKDKVLHFDDREVVRECLEYLKY
ncbi:MAG: UDP-N-acetylmuramoyl-L-alanyl-D-glutamate--2,6-diaminopimelate ligase [Candidatus Omnitrophica bacterium]|nr:UDP-N-acetylmuramoyl-L-alanyl-D-glutamate--2,6-diaminopimelate ligase [Candidatus Omnitrophota bacterium]